MKILFIGDIVGKAGRKAVAENLPKLKKSLKIDLVIANAENATHGTAPSLKSYEELKESGVNFITLGDHSFRSKENRDLLSGKKSDIIRPANLPPQLPGQGCQLIEVGTKKVLIANLLGRVFMKFDYDCPFRAMDKILEKYKNEKISAIIVDIHGEATSEKTAFGLHYDGKISAVLGTHTHVPTCDNKILPEGTAYVTDVGMVGASNSVIGAKKEPIIQMFLEQHKISFEPEEDGPCSFNSVLIEVDPKTKKAKSIKRIDSLIRI